MKKCPFCAEEIQEEAIKCRHCGTFLSQAPSAGGSAAAAAPAASPAPAAAAAAAPAGGAPFTQGRAAGGGPTERKILYEGSPSWRAFVGQYILGVLAAIIAPIIMNWMANKIGVSTSTHALMILIPLGLVAIYFAALYFMRKSVRFRITTTNIESEKGVLSKKIDVLELWRCRDIRYKQNILDRIMGIAHIEIFTADVTTPDLEIVGLPASRQLFEDIRDRIQLQRQAQNVYGVVS